MKNVINRALAAKKKILICLLALLPLMALQAKVDKQVVELCCEMHCQGCCDKITKNIAYEKGVKDIVCNLDKKRVTVTYDANKTDVEKLLAAFEKIGKPARLASEVEAEQAAAKAAKQKELDKNLMNVNPKTLKSSKEAQLKDGEVKRMPAQHIKSQPEQAEPAKQEKAVEKRPATDANTGASQLQ